MLFALPHLSQLLAKTFNSCIFMNLSACRWNPVSGPDEDTSFRSYSAPMRVSFGNSRGRKLSCGIFIVSGCSGITLDRAYYGTNTSVRANRNFCGLQEEHLGSCFGAKSRFPPDRWPVCSGVGGRNKTEAVAEIVRNMEVCCRLRYSHNYYI